MKIFLSGAYWGSAKQAMLKLCESGMKIFLSGIQQGAGGGQKEAMKTFLSAVESSPDKQRAILRIAQDTPLLWNLMSYYYIGNDEPYAERIRDCSDSILIDSGAHSFQKGKKVD